MLTIFRRQGGISGLSLLDKSSCGLPGAFFWRFMALTSDVPIARLHAL